MKTITGKLSSTVSISLSNSAKILSDFAVSDHGASHAVSLYLQRASDSFNRLVKFHQKLTDCVKNEHFYDAVKVEENSGFEEPYMINNSTNLRNHKKRREIGENHEADKPDKVERNRKSLYFGDKVKDQKLIKIEKRPDRGEDEAAAAEVLNDEKYGNDKREIAKPDSSLKMEMKLVNEDVAISRDKTMRKKRRSVDEVEKVDDELVIGDAKTKKKRKSVDINGGEHIGSAEQSNKKKTKKRRIGEE